MRRTDGQACVPGVEREGRGSTPIRLKRFSGGVLKEWVIVRSFGHAAWRCVQPVWIDPLSDWSTAAS
jgi:hypothetical protein